MSGYATAYNYICGSSSAKKKDKAHHQRMRGKLVTWSGGDHDGPVF